MWVLLLLITGFIIGYSLAVRSPPLLDQHMQIAQKAIDILSTVSSTVTQFVSPQESGSIRFITNGTSPVEKALISFTFQKQVISYITRIANVDVNLKLQYIFSSHSGEVILDPTIISLEIIRSDGSIDKVQTIISPPYLSEEYGDGYLKLSITDIQGNNYTTPLTHNLNTYQAIEEFERKRKNSNLSV